MYGESFFHDFSDLPNNVKHSEVEQALVLWSDGFW